MSSPADTIREARAKIVSALNLTPLVPPNADTETLNVVEDAWRALSDIAAALTELEADRDRYREALEQAVRTIDHWDATIGQPPDPPSAEEMLFAVRDLARAALDRHTKEQT
jgi:hypothetical protein